MNKRAVAILSLGHLINDTYPSTIYPLLPLLAGQLQLGERQVFFLLPVLSITGAFMQPVYGLLADRYSRRMFAVLGPAVSGCFISLIGVAPSYWTLLACLFCGGVGSGAFHPQAVSLSAQAGGDRRQVAVSVFMSAGTLGLAVGPLMIALIVGATDLSSTVFTMGLGLIASLLLYLYCPSPSQRVVENPRPGPGSPLGWRRLAVVQAPLLILYSISLSRAALHMLIGNFLPFILKAEGYSVEATGGVLSAYMLAGALGSFAGGPLAEWIGERAVNWGSGLVTTVCLVFAFFLPGIPAVALLALGAFALMSVTPVNVTQAQELAPGRMSTVSAVLMGLVWGVGSLAPPLVGPLAVNWGFRPVLMMAAVLPCLTGFLAFALPEGKPLRKGLSEVPLIVSSTGD
jgi:FSR family fosmidomycin resistance protein-like MFS transporter